MAEEDEGPKISPSTPSICKPGTYRRRKRQRCASDEEPHDILQMINDSNEKLAASIERGTEMVVDLVKNSRLHLNECSWHLFKIKKQIET